MGLTLLTSVFTFTSCENDYDNQIQEGTLACPLMTRSEMGSSGDCYVNSGNGTIDKEISNKVYLHSDISWPTGLTKCISPTTLSTIEIRDCAKMSVVADSFPVAYFLGNVIHVPYVCYIRQVHYDIVYGESVIRIDTTRYSGEETYECPKGTPPGIKVQ